VRGGVSWHGVDVSLSVENIFDRLYFDYLSPPAAAMPPSGSLRPGSRIPGPGRDILLTIRFRGW
jgi:outer membrane receptor protein involved in Fe transport